MLLPSLWILTVCQAGVMSVRLPRRILTKILLKKLKSVLGHLFHTGKTSIQKSSYGKFHMVPVSLSSLLHLLLPTTTTAIGKNAFRLSFLETSITDLGGKYVFCSLEICTSDVCCAMCCKLHAHRHSLMQQTKIILKELTPSVFLSCVSGTQTYSPDEYLC